MKYQLDTESTITRLRRNEKLKPSCLYILTSESVSGTLYFESKKDIVFAHRLIDRHLSKVLNIVSYMFTSSGWALVVSIKDEQGILKSVRGKKFENELVGIDYSFVISEHIRYMISALVKQINARTGRKGSLVSRTFSRYMCQDVSGATEVFCKLEKCEYDLMRQERRYRASQRYWDESKDFREKGSVFLSSLNRRKKGYRGYDGYLLTVCRAITKDVLHQVINFTKKTHFKPFPSHKSKPIPILPS